MKKHNDQNIRDALKEMINDLRIKPKLHQIKLPDIWAQLMGPGIAGYTRSIRLRNKKLYLQIDSAPLRQELSYGKEKIRDLLNEQLGEEAIKEVIVR